MHLTAYTQTHMHINILPYLTAHAAVCIYRIYQYLMTCQMVYTLTCKYMSIPEFMHLLHTLLNAYMFHIFTNISPSA